MIVYKLMRLMKDGTLASPFIGKSKRYTLGEWYDSEYIPIKGFKPRPGWHATFKPEAPHLSIKGRVWVKCETGDVFWVFTRPNSQGGKRVIPSKIRFLEVLPLDKAQ